MNPTTETLTRIQHRLNDRLNDAGKYKSQDRRYLLKCGNGPRPDTLSKRTRKHLARHPNDLQAKQAAKINPRRGRRIYATSGYNAAVSDSELCELKGRADHIITTVTILHKDNVIASGNSSQEAWSQIDEHQYCFAGGLPTGVRFHTDEKTEEMTLNIFYRSTVSKWISFERRENQLEYGNTNRFSRKINGQDLSNEAKVVYCEAKFQAKTVAQLKLLCTLHRLPVSGKKGLLIVRLVTFFGLNPQHGTEFQVDGGEEE